MQGHSGPDVLIQQAGLGLELGIGVMGRIYQHNDNSSNSYHLLSGQ